MTRLQLCTWLILTALVVPASRGNGLPTGGGICWRCEGSPFASGGAFDVGGLFGASSEVASESAPSITAAPEVTQDAPMVMFRHDINDQGNLALTQALSYLPPLMTLVGRVEREGQTHLFAVRNPSDLGSARFLLGEFQTQMETARTFLEAGEEGNDEGGLGLARSLRNRVHWRRVRELVSGWVFQDPGASGSQLSVVLEPLQLSQREIEVIDPTQRKEYGQLIAPSSLPASSPEAWHHSFLRAKSLLDAVGSPADDLDAVESWKRETGRTPAPEDTRLPGSIQQQLLPILQRATVLLEASAELAMLRLLTRDRQELLNHDVLLQRMESAFEKAEVLPLGNTDGDQTFQPLSGMQVENYSPGLDQRVTTSQIWERERQTRRGW